MMDYHVQITDRALRDMGMIYEYIAEEFCSPENALNQYNRIADSIEKLSFFPQKYRLLEMKPQKAINLRILTVDHYCVIFTIQNESVIVLRVLYGASDINSRLSNL